MFTTPLHQFGSWLRESLAAVPHEVARGLFVALLVGLAVWVARLPRGRTSEPVEEAPDGSTASGRSRDLRPWALLALGTQVLLYLVF